MPGSGTLFRQDGEMTPDQVREFVSRCIVREAILMIVPRLSAAYQSAWQCAFAEFSDAGFRADALPSIRRSKVEHELTEVGNVLSGQFPERVAVGRGKSGRWNRTELFFDQLRITQCRTAGKDGAPPKALHRAEYAKANEAFGQLELFDDPPSANAFPPTMPCFGVLTHGGHSNDGPQFLSIRIMETNGVAFFGGEFDLLAEYSKLVKPIEQIDIDEDFGPEWKDQSNVG